MNNPQRRITMKHSLLNIHEICYRYAVIVLTACAVVSVAESAPIAGALPDYPDHFEKVEYNDIFILGSVETEILPHGEAVIRWTTKVPTPRSVVYYGVQLPDQDLDYPRFRSWVQERIENDTCEHAVLINVKQLEQAKYDAGRFAEHNRGTVCFRIEAFDPEESYTRYFNGRFSYRRIDTVYAAGITITEGPFVDAVTPGQAVISWKTDVPTYGSVITHSTVVYFASCSTYHEVQLRDLVPGTVTYKVSSWIDNDTVISRPFRFRVPSPDVTRFKFVFLSDSREGSGGGEESIRGVNYGALRELFSAMFYKGVDFILFGGDLVNGYTTDVEDFREQCVEWKRAVEPIGHYIPIYEGMGNHEALVQVYKDSAGYGIWFDKHGDESAETVFAQEFVNPGNGPEPEGPGLPPYKENVYSFDYGNMHVICINTNYFWASRPEIYGGNLEGYIMDQQLQWLEIDMQIALERGVEHIIVFGHEPAFPNGGHLGDAMWYSGGDQEANHGIDRQYVVKRRDEFWKLLSAYKVLAYCCGDEHNYQRVLIDKNTPAHLDNTPNPGFINPVWQIVNGCAGAPYYAQETAPWSDAVRLFSSQVCYTMLIVEGKKVLLETYSRTGQLIDQCELTAFK
jgi:hypothetical protein